MAWKASEQANMQMKNTEVQTLGELRMRGTANWWAGLLSMRLLVVSPASSSQRVLHGLATALDRMRESIHALRCVFLCLQEQADQVEVSLW